MGNFRIFARIRGIGFPRYLFDLPVWSMKHLFRLVVMSSNELYAASPFEIILKIAFAAPQKVGIEGGP